MRKNAIQNFQFQTKLIEFLAGIIIASETILIDFVNPKTNE